MKKAIVMSLVAAFAFANFAVAGSTSPKIVKIKDVKKTQMDVQIQKSSLAKKKCLIELEVKNETTKDTVVKKLTKKLDRKGKVDLTVKGLTSKTQYRFTVRIRRDANQAWSDWSSHKYHKTK